VDVFDYDRAAGLHGRRPFVTLDAETKHPDGLAVDREGGVWVAMNGAGVVRRYTPAGAFDDVVEVPVANVTACTFGGAALDELFITTSQEGSPPGAVPMAGALFRVSVGVRGMPVREFAG
jgi:sugar lactone lactonase YvrE